MVLTIINDKDMQNDRVFHSCVETHLETCPFPEQ